MKIQCRHGYLCISNFRIHNFCATLLVSFLALDTKRAAIECVLKDNRAERTLTYQRFGFGSDVCMEFVLIYRSANRLKIDLGEDTNNCNWCLAGIG